MSDTPKIQNPMNQASTAQDAIQQANYSPGVSLDDLERRITALEQGKINLTTDIFGLFEVVSAVPAGKPSNVYDQVKIYHSGATRTLYLYDYSENRWDSVALS